jgi:hypothetical protein
VYNFSQKVVPFLQNLQKSSGRGSADDFYRNLKISAESSENVQLSAVPQHKVRVKYFIPLPCAVIFTAQGKGIKYFTLTLCCKHYSTR